ncbi:related to MVD1 - mevalonate pyrophosphate decarboxylase [Ustilago trichophora]|uniref:Related to MVD1 - mevalonate pyrophosphate decarboxylase n=1 Tax=Ustilago trichophora TaxID=86804 RepID=A0A5C3E704_9BASI|nr:related to MVD1 - mevalonate pyrophosphate decarboxylase [Ustilago trichophora]
MSSTVYQATCSAPVNIAVIKYWGKKDTTLILPTNDSLSVTLDQDHLRSVTTARADASFAGQDRLWLNGEEEIIKEGGRLRRCIDEMKKLRQAKEAKDASLPKNNFPTAAGLASSASGFAALIASLAALYELQPECRAPSSRVSLVRGGEQPSGADSLAVEVALISLARPPGAHLCRQRRQKGHPSTAGMQRTVQTSPLLQHRIHRAIVQLVEELNRANEAEGKGKLVAYTYDAGPNAVLYAPKANMDTILQTIRHYFPNADFDDTFNLLGKGVNASHRGAQESSVCLIAPKRLQRQCRRWTRVLERGFGTESLLGDNGEPLRLQRAKRA